MDVGAHSFLVDPSHRRRVYGSHLYKLVNLCRQFKKPDAETLIHNFGYALKQNQGKSHEQFKIAMTASFEHEFNDHTFCGSWCKYVKLPPDQWQPLNVQTGCKLHNKILDAHMYLEAKAVHEQFTTDENLERLNHEFNSKKMKQ